MGRSDGWAKGEAGRRGAALRLLAGAALALTASGVAGCAPTSGGSDLGAGLGFERGALVRGNQRYSVAYLPDQQAAIFRFSLVTSLSEGGAATPAPPSLEEVTAAAQAEAPAGCALGEITEQEAGVYEARYVCAPALSASEAAGD